MNADRAVFLRRWAPCVSMLLLSLLSYADRSVLAILSPTILNDLHMSATQYGYAVSAFSICYMVANPMWGYWIDRRGVWVTVLVAVALWSLASGAHAFMVGLTGMCLARGVLGFGEGATFPAGLATVTETLPEERRSFGLGLAYSGGSLGAALAPLVITPIALRWGWRPTFVLTSVMGLLWVLLWIAMRAAGLSPQPVTAVKRMETEGTFSRFFSKLNRNLFATAAAYGLCAAPLAFALYVAPLYLSRVLHVSQGRLGHLLWIPPAGWETGYLVWGAIADRRKRNGGLRPGPIFTWIAAAGFLIVLAPIAARSAYPVFATMLLFYVLMTFIGGVVVVSLSDGMTMQPKENSGFLAGFAITSWALVTGVLAPVLGHLVDRKAYTQCFWMMAFFPVAGTLMWRVLRRPPSVAPVA